MAQSTDSNMIMSECHSCRYRRSIPGDCHISCAAPDPKMTGNEHGIKHGWFFYPFNFDPVWKTKLCSHYIPACPVGSVDLKEGPVVLSDKVWNYTERRWQLVSETYDGRLAGHEASAAGLRLFNFIREK